MRLRIKQASKLRSDLMERPVNSYSAFDISTAGESLEISSSENVHSMKKSRRLTMEQIRALEKSFQLGKTLVARRKEELAGALGLHPKQIAIWFQNRRAKLKTTQLEKDFSVLKENYESLKVHYHSLLEENKKLQSQIQSLSNILENDQNKEIMGDGQIDVNIDKEIKEECYGVLNNAENNITKEAAIEENCGRNALWAVEEEDRFYNMGEISGFMLIDHWSTPASFQ